MSEFRYAEISLVEAAVRLKRSPKVIAKKALVVSTELQAKRALASKRLPGRKIGRVWLFQSQHVTAFGRIKRPAGRPALPSLSAAQAAEELGLAESTIRTLVGQGTLKARHVRSRLSFAREDIERYDRGRRRNPDGRWMQQLNESAMRRLTKLAMKAPGRPARRAS
jgi:Helix-turn-helix domain